MAASVLAFATTASAQSGADLSITFTNNQTSLTRGHWVNYAFTATNNGPEAAQGAEISYTVPAGLEYGTFSGISGASGWTCSTLGPGNPVFSCTRSTPMPVGQTASAQLSLKVKPDASGSIANTITLTSTTIDPNPANNAASDTDPVIVPVTVPTLTEWAMILMGTLLAAGAALTLHRRHQTA